jgi:hypothetical protein
VVQIHPHPPVTSNCFVTTIKKETRSMNAIERIIETTRKAWGIQEKE